MESGLPCRARCSSISIGRTAGNSLTWSSCRWGSSPRLTPSRSPGAGMASSEDETRGLLIAYDTIAAPGQRVTLVVELLEDGMLTHPPLGGEVLLFKEGSKLLGRAMTGGDGRALLSVVPRRVGASTVVVGLAGSPRAAASEATARLFVWDRRRAIVLGSLNALVVRSRSPGLRIPLPRAGDQRPAPEAGAVHALKELGRRAYLP